LTPNLLHGIEETVFLPTPLPTPHTYAFTVVIVVVVVVGFVATAWGMASMASKMERIFPGLEFCILHPGSQKPLIMQLLN
jgi:hypothetical protein